MKGILLGLLLLPFLLLAQSPPTREASIEEPDELEAVLSHSIWEDLLQKHVSDSGRVNYEGFQEDIDQLDEYLKLLRQHPADTSWKRSDQLAYWLNVFNAFTVRVVLDHYPINSIRDLEKGKIWDLKYIKLGRFSYTLNDITHEIVLKNFGDARALFALNNAAKSSPRLYPHAFVGKNLNQQLQRHLYLFLNDPRLNEITPERVYISPIFNWYEEEVIRQFGSLINMLAVYTKKSINPEAAVHFHDFDWGLNE